MGHTRDSHTSCPWNFGLFDLSQRNRRFVHLRLSVSMEEMAETRHARHDSPRSLLAILEAAVLECKKRNVNTPEVSATLDLLEPYIWPKWLIPQFRQEVSNGYPHRYRHREGQQQVLCATFPRIRDAVRELLGVRMDALARKFHETHDMKLSDEIYRLAGEYGKLKEPWVFRP